jgi:lysophospholipase L1-like esterase
MKNQRSILSALFSLPAVLLLSGQIFAADISTPSTQTSAQTSLQALSLPAPVTMVAPGATAAPVKYVAALVGQSNETFPWWTTVSTLLLREKNVSLTVRNTAVGSSSLAESWVGRVRPWTKYALLLRGSYMTYAGKIYRANMDFGTVKQTLVPPTPVIGTDGVNWTYVGPSSLQPAGKTIVSRTNKVLFDPNGFMSRARNALSGVPVANQWVFISIGQTDKTMTVARDEYSAALVEAAGYFSDIKVVPFVGFTLRGTLPGMNDWYDANLLPAWTSVVNTTAAKNVKVYTAGANLSTALGKLPVSSDPKVPGLADGLHMNAAAQALAAREWANVLENYLSKKP